VAFYLIINSIIICNITYLKYTRAHSIQLSALLFHKGSREAFKTICQ